MRWRVAKCESGDAVPDYVATVKINVTPYQFKITLDLTEGIKESISLILLTLSQSNSIAVT